MLTMEIDFLEAPRKERDEQKRRYMMAYRDALTLGDLRPAEQEEFNKITDKYVP
jgi:hypothetical protein